MAAKKKTASDEELIHTTEDSEENSKSQVNNGTSSQGNVGARRPGVTSVEAIRQLSPRNALLRMLRRRWALNSSPASLLREALARAGLAAGGAKPSGAAAASAGSGGAGVALSRRASPRRLAAAQ